MFLAGAPSPAQALAAQFASHATGALAPEAATFAVYALSRPCAAASGRRPPAATGGLLPAERGGKETGVFLLFFRTQSRGEIIQRQI